MAISKKRLQEIDAIKDENIDYNDIPELDKAFWKRSSCASLHPSKVFLCALMTMFCSGLKVRAKATKRALTAYCVHITRRTNNCLAHGAGKRGSVGFFQGTPPEPVFAEKVGVLNATDMLGVKFTARITIRNADVVSFVLPVFGARPEVQQIMPGKLNVSLINVPENQWVVTRG
ncbi:hypothetical protein ACVBEJ_01380 [Porticoccus sp. GXU_MW_L64]